MISEKKNRIKGILGTILVHAVALLLLFLLALRTPLPLPGEEGVIVNLGYDETGLGLEQRVNQPTAEPEPEPDQITEEAETDYLVQDIEEAPAIEKKKKDEQKKEPEKVIQKPAEEVVKPFPDPEPEPVPEPKTDPRAIYKGKGTTTAQGGQEGVAGGEGDQGDPSGTPGANIYKGKSGNGTGEGTGSGTGTGAGEGSGTGIVPYLGGRGSLVLFKPSYDSREQGRVVVSIKVDRSGKVTSATAGAKGTNVSDQSLWQLARDAALRSTFEADPDAPESQIGTITYNFIRQN
ncbi:MAG: energy transducer TonB [Bacteroidales bacterium]|jgi:outer membrane biosynthesis protein TonB|nr:energy transducer TonB [Bacteroidales bacterium]